jgi:alpha-N-acetylglucosamine transferase
MVEEIPKKTLQKIFFIPQAYGQLSEKDVEFVGKKKKKRFGLPVPFTDILYKAAVL